jgi:hypothetical protein
LEITDALWELVPVVVAAGEAHDQLSPAEVADRSPAGMALDAEARRRLRDLGEGFTQAMESAGGVDELDETAWDNVTVTQVMTDPFGTMSGLFDMHAYGARVAADPAFVQLGTELSNASGDERSYLITYLQAVMRSPRTPVLLRAFFAAAVGSVEPLVARYVTLLLFDANAGAYESLADPSLEERARNLSRGGPASWRQALVETLGVSVAADAVDWEGLGKRWEQRNVIVHRGGVGDARYSRLTGGQVGDVPASDPQDVRAAIDEIGGTRFGLAASVWDRITPGMGDLIAGATYLPFSASLKAGRWRQALGLARVDAAFAVDAEGAADAKVNKWLALDMGLGPEAIEDQVQKWDLTGLPDVYRMAQHLLLRHDDKGLALIHDLLANGSVSRSDLAGWPLFKRWRDEGRLSDLPPGG